MNQFYNGIILSCAFISFSKAQAQQKVSEEILHYFDQKLLFIENKGQWNKDLLYRSKSGPAHVWVKNNGVVIGIQEEVPNTYAYFNLLEMRPGDHGYNEMKAMCPDPNMPVKQHVWYMNFAGSNPDKTVQSVKKAEGVYNYFIGNDFSKHASNVNGYNEVWYRNLYNNIDARLYSSANNELEYDMIVMPHGNVSDIKINFDGLPEVQINKDGSVTLVTHVGNLTKPAPVAYQKINGKEIKVSCHYIKINNNTIGFEINGSYDKAQPLVIDPIAMLWSSYLGGGASSNANDYGHAHTSDVDTLTGNMFVGGWYANNNLPTTVGAYDQTFNGVVPTDANAFVAKFNASGSALVFCTYVGGSTNVAGGSTYQTVSGLKLSVTGEVICVGYSSYTNFPTTAGVLNTTYRGGVNDVVAFKLSAAGNSLLWSTFIGGTADDQANGFNIDKGGNLYIPIFTTSTNASLTASAGAFQTNNGGAYDGYFMKLSSNGTTRVWATYYGGNDTDIFENVAIDKNDSNLMFVGYTESTNFSTTPGAYQTAWGTGTNRGAIVKINMQTGARLASTLYGAPATYARLFCIRQDNESKFFIGGAINNGLPFTPTAVQKVFAGGTTDGFVARINYALDSVNYTSYLGGNGNEQIQYFSNEPYENKNIYLVMSTSSTNLKVPSAPFQTTNFGGFDWYFAKVNNTLDTILYATYIGGTGNELDPINFDGIHTVLCKIYTSLTTASTNFPTTVGALQNTTSMAAGNILPTFQAWSEPPPFTPSNSILPSDTGLTGCSGYTIGGTNVGFTLPQIRRGAAGPVAHNPMPSTNLFRWQFNTGFGWYFIDTATSQNHYSGPISTNTFFRRVVDYTECGGSNVVFVHVNNICNTFLGNDDNNVTMTRAAVSGTVMTNEVDPQDHAMRFYGFYNPNTQDTIPDRSGNLSVIPGVDSNGVATTNAGSFVYDSTGNYVFTPASGFKGYATIHYLSCDNQATPGCEISTLIIHVTDSGYSAGSDVVPFTDNYLTMMGTTLTGNVKANDKDHQGHVITVQKVYNQGLNKPAAGPSTITIVRGKNLNNNFADTAYTYNAGTLQLNFDGSFTYVPAAGFIGTLNVPYEVCSFDNNNVKLTCKVAYLRINVDTNLNGNANDKPSAADDVAFSVKNKALNGYLGGNDRDINGDTLRFKTTLVKAPTKGNVVLNKYGYYTYTPNLNYIGSDQFIYQVCDTLSAFAPQNQCVNATAYLLIFDTVINTPVTLINFYGLNKKDHTQLIWVTGSEQNNDRFEVEKRIAGDWVKIGTVKGNGTTQAMNNYTLNDMNPFIGDNFYRLKQIDYNGKFIYSDVIKVPFKGTVYNILVQPNPATNEINVSFTTDLPSQHITITMFDLTGKQLMEEETTSHSGVNSIRIDLQGLASGIYLLQLNTPDGTKSVKVVKN